MRTKLFISFILIIFIALLSNIVFEDLIIKDFDDYVKSMEEDRIYWLLASVEGSYRDGKWDSIFLRESLHWAMMLGFEAYIEDRGGKKIISTQDVLKDLNQSMLKRMSSLFDLPTGVGEFSWYPLYVEGSEIGRLYVRPLKRLGFLPQKEDIFRRRGKEFLLISFLIAGGGALFVAVLFTLFLSNPIRHLTVAAERVASGDFSVKPVVPHQLNRLYRFFKCDDEIDRLTHSFNYMVDALRKEDALRRHLTSNIVHELRTPLSIMKGNLEAVEDGIIKDPRVVLKTLQVEIERLIELVEGIDDITRAEASFFKRGRPERINLRDFIESVSSAFHGLFSERGLFLELQGDSDATVTTYPDKLQIILKNLLSNALKFTDSGGITISWGKDRKGLFTITVEDTGRGMEAEEVEKIFDRFYKASHSKGRGLGLAIVKELLDTIEGEAEVESNPGQGSVFRITIREARE
ncbi:MAG: HAMP domain-containing histidine kinase [Nitrospirae bacterium]|nr:HAMP domain-containing histidine kinase [Nitrospirota bacterium]